MFNQAYRFNQLMSFEMGMAYQAMNIVSDPDVAIAAEWGKAEQGEPGGYDISERPPMPSAQNVQGPGTLRP
jgi:hypothetical protein